MSVSGWRPSGAHRYDVFLSYRWRTAQDQAIIFQLLLPQQLPGLRCFLDISNLQAIEDLERYVAESKVVIALLTGSMEKGVFKSDYFSSENCLREMRATLGDRAKTIILLLETDPDHGGGSLEAHQKDCPADLRPDLFGESARAKVVRWVRFKPARTASHKGDLSCTCDLIS